MKHLKNKKILAILALIIADMVFFGLVNPRDVASVILFTGFLLLAANIALICYLGLRILRVLTGRPKGGIRRLTAGVTIIAVVLLAMQSIGQLTARDGIVLAALLGIFWFYGSYYRRKAA